MMAEQILDKIDTMGKRVDTLEKSVSELIAQTGGIEDGGNNNTPTTRHDEK